VPVPHSPECPHRTPRRRLRPPGAGDRTRPADRRVDKVSDDSEARARSAEATIFLSYADVPSVWNCPRATAGSGNRVTFKDLKVAGRVALSEAGEKSLGQVFAEPIAPRNIPDGLRPRSFTTAEQGLTAHFSGTSVTFRRDDVQDTSANGSAGPGRVGRREIRCRRPEGP
jgi:hypothetical protein